MQAIILSLLAYIPGYDQKKPQPLPSADTTNKATSHTFHKREEDKFTQKQPAQLPGVTIILSPEKLLEEAIKECRLAKDPNLFYFTLKDPKDGKFIWLPGNSNNKEGEESCFVVLEHKLPGVPSVYTIKRATSGEWLHRYHNKEFYIPEKNLAPEQKYVVQEVAKSDLGLMKKSEEFYVFTKKSDLTTSLNIDIERAKAYFLPNGTFFIEAEGDKGNKKEFLIFYLEGRWCHDNELKHYPGNREFIIGRFDLKEDKGGSFNSKQFPDAKCYPTDLGTMFVIDDKKEELLLINDNGSVKKLRNYKHIKNLGLAPSSDGSWKSNKEGGIFFLQGDGSVIRLWRTTAGKPATYIYNDNNNGNIIFATFDECLTNPKYFTATKDGFWTDPYYPGEWLLKQDGTVIKWRPIKQTSQEENSLHNNSSHRSPSDGSSFDGKEYYINMAGGKIKLADDPHTRKLQLKALSGRDRF